MEYVIADRTRAEEYGFKAESHATRDDRMCLNEKEVMNHPYFSGTLEERAERLKGKVATLSEAKMQIGL